MKQNRATLFGLMPLSAILMAGIAYCQAEPVVPIELDVDRQPAVKTGGNALIRGARVITITGQTYPSADILVRDGKIAAIGPNLQVPQGFEVIDARGRVAMPGIVDAHVHRASDSTNEGSDSITAEVRMFDVLNPRARNIWQALASGHTSALVLHGSANTVGGQSQVIKYKVGKTEGDLVIEDAPRIIKFALGENVTRKGGAQTRFPGSRMGVEAMLRRGFEEAKKYRTEWRVYEAQQRAGIRGIPPRKDLRLETLADILDQKIWVHSHCYRADEMLMLVRLSQEYGFKIGAMQHALEAYKIAPELARAGIGVSVFADNWAFKVESYDAIPYNSAICMLAGAEVSVNTDGVSGTAALNVDAAKLLRFGVSDVNEVLKTITINPARQLGIDHRTGSLEVGKDADIVLWSGHPLSVYSKPMLTMVEGEVYFQRRDAFDVDRYSAAPAEMIATPGRPFIGAKAPVSPNGRYALVGAEIFPVSSPAISNGTLLVRNGRIEAVRPGRHTPAGYTVIDVSGKKIYPGFIDSGGSMGMVEIDSVATMIDNREIGLIQPDIRTAMAYNVESELIPVARAAGILTAMSSPVVQLIGGQGAVIRLAGFTTEELVVVPDSGLYVTWPETGAPPPPPPGDPLLHSVCCGSGSVFDLLPEQFIGDQFFESQKGAHSHDHDHDHDHDCDDPDHDHGPMAAQPRGQGGQATGRLADLLNFFTESQEYLARNVQPGDRDYDLKKEAMRPYLNGERPIFARVRTVTGIRSVLQYARNSKANIVLVGAPDAWKVADEIAEVGLPVILVPAGLSVLSANNTVSPWDPYDTPYATAELLRRAGVKFSFQSAGAAMAMTLPTRVGMSVGFGLPQEAAVRALTLSAAEILGVADELGSLDAGKRATFIVTDGDPFEQTSMVRYAFIDGKPVSLETKFTRLYQKYLERL